MRRWQSNGWGRSQKPHVLVEDSSEAYDHAHFEAFQRAGFEVARCGGPDESDDCPHETTDGCPFASRADVIAWGFDVSSPEHRRVLQEHERRHAGTPIVFFTHDGQRAETVSDRGGLYPRATSVSGQVRIVQAALAATWPARQPNAPARTVGPVSSTEREHAQRTLGELDRIDSGARVVCVELVRQTDPTWDRPALARATLEVDGRITHVHADATTMLAAIDLLYVRIRDRIGNRMGARA